MRVLVTGAGGFAGGHMARRLAEAGFEVLAATRASPVTPPASAEAARRFRIVSGALESVDLPGEFEAVVHTAATSIWTGISVDRMLTDNVAATQALVRRALDARARAFVFFSSVSAFGTVSADTLTEAEPSVDLDAYGATKLLGEQLLADVAAELPSLSIRLPAVIGRGSKRNWPSECLRKLRAGLELQAFNPEARFNNVVHERDLAALVRQALAQGIEGRQVVVVGSGGETRIRDVVRIMAERTRSRSRISFVERVNHPFLIDCAKARRLYGFRPMDIETALAAFTDDAASSP